MYSWSPSTSFSALPATPPRAAGAAPRGIDLRGAVDWDDFAATRWALAGRGDERPTLTPHALDGLSFPVTLAWAMQQPRVADAIRDARRGATARDARAAARAAGVAETEALGDADPDAPPLEEAAVRAVMQEAPPGGVGGKQLDVATGPAATSQTASEAAAWTNQTCYRQACWYR